MWPRSGSSRIRWAAGKTEFVEQEGVQASARQADSAVLGRRASTHASAHILCDAPAGPVAGELAESLCSGLDCSSRGAIAQLGERLDRTQEVAGSSRLAPPKKGPQMRPLRLLSRRSDRLLSTSSGLRGVRRRRMRRSRSRWPRPGRRSRSGRWRTVGGRGLRRAVQLPWRLPDPLPSSAHQAGLCDATDGGSELRRLS